MKWPGGQKEKGLLPLLTAAAFLFQVLLPFAAVYHAPGETDAVSSAISFNGKIILCTPDGFKLVSLEDLRNGREKPATHEDYQCPLCYLAAHQSIRQRVADLTAAPLPVTAQLSFFAASGTIHSSAANWRKPLTRAPPSPSFT